MLLDTWPIRIERPLRINPPHVRTGNQQQGDRCASRMAILLAAVELMLILFVLTALAVVKVGKGAPL